MARKKTRSIKSRARTNPNIKNKNTDNKRNEMIWWAVSVLPIVTTGFLVLLLNLSYPKHISVSLDQIRSIEIEFQHSPVAYKSPACGCAGAQGSEWYGATFVVNKIELGPLRSSNGSQTAYNLSSPFPSQLSYVRHNEFPIVTSIFGGTEDTQSGLNSLESFNPLNSDADPITSAAITTQIRRATRRITIVSEMELSIVPVSEIPVAAWVPVEDSVLEITSSASPDGGVELDVVENIRFSRSVISDRIENDQPRNGMRLLQYPVIDFIGSEFLIEIPRDATIYYGERPVILREERPPGERWIMLISAPYSLRVGVQNWNDVTTPNAVASLSNNDEMLFPGETTPASLPARIYTDPNTERIAVAAIRRTPSAMIRWRFWDGVERLIQMVAPPVPDMHGTNIFGPIREVRFLAATGDIVVGADPFPSIAAPSNIDMAASNSIRHHREPIPIRVEEGNSRISTEYAARANLRINGELITNINSALRGPFKDIINVASILAALAWLLTRYRSYQKLRNGFGRVSTRR